jgi:5-methylcytosine-specific restriction endonuclease McrA
MPYAAPTHKPKQAIGTKRHSQQYDHAFLCSASWLKLRKLVLQRDRYMCQSPGCGVPVGLSGHVDHKIDRRERPDLALDMDNCETLCASCHSRKTGATR